MKFILCILFSNVVVHKGGEAIEVGTTLPPEVTTILNQVGDGARRIINGDEVTDELPYMVHLKLAPHDPKQQDYRSWLCGGAIIHEEYVLTSAACIQDANHFYIVSGTFTYADDADRHSSACIKNGAKKAIWKCVPKNYIFDGHENDNVRWMNNDIAVVKIEDGFDFTRRIRGCDFIPKPICYNNQTQTLENPGTIAQIAGWGSTEGYHERKDTKNNPHLLYSLVELISKDRCKRRWGQRYHNIIDNYMICSKDLGQTMTEVCNEKYVDCADISYDDDEMLRRTGIRVTKTDRVPTNLLMHSAYHNETFRKRLKGDSGSGGFCENDHGGPLVVGSGVNSIVIGVISACLVQERTNHCYGPFLYTSVYKNRQFLSCVIYKNLAPKCRRQFRTGVTHNEYNMSWINHPDGPARNELGPGVKPPPILYDPISITTPKLKLSSKAATTTSTTSKTKRPKTNKTTKVNTETTAMPTKANLIKAILNKKAKKETISEPIMRIGQLAKRNLTGKRAKAARHKLTSGKSANVSRKIKARKSVNTTHVHKKKTTPVPKA